MRNSFSKYKLQFFLLPLLALTIAQGCAGEDSGDTHVDAKSSGYDVEGIGCQEDLDDHYGDASRCNQRPDNGSNDKTGDISNDKPKGDKPPGGDGGDHNSGTTPTPEPIDQSLEVTWPDTARQYLDQAESFTRVGEFSFWKTGNSVNGRDFGTYSKNPGVDNALLELGLVLRDAQNLQGVELEAEIASLNSELITKLSPDQTFFLDHRFLRLVPGVVHPYFKGVGSIVYATKSPVDTSLELLPISYGSSIDPWFADHKSFVPNQQEQSTGTPRVISNPAPVVNDRARFQFDRLTLPVFVGPFQLEVEVQGVEIEAHLEPTPANPNVIRDGVISGVIPVDDLFELLNIELKRQVDQTCNCYRPVATSEWIVKGQNGRWSFKPGKNDETCLDIYTTTPPTDCILNPKHYGSEKLSALVEAIQDVADIDIDYLFNKKTSGAYTWTGLSLGYTWHKVDE